MTLTFVTHAALPRLAALVIVFSLAACAREQPAPGTSSPPPPTRVAVVTETLHGVTVTDRYRWLEDDTPEVATWTDAQNRHTRTVLDALPGRKTLEDRLQPLVQIGSVTAPLVRANRYFYARRAPGQDRPTVFMREGALGGERALIDPAKGATAGHDITWLSPSQDGKVLAYGTDQGRQGLSTLRLIDIEGSAMLPDEIPNVLEGVQWLPDGSGFLYDSVRDPADPGSRQGLMHRLRTPLTADPLLYRNVAKPGSPAGAAAAGGPSATLSRDGRWLVLTYWMNAESNDVWVASFNEYLRTGSRAARPVSIGVPGTATGTVIDDMLYLQTTKSAPNGRIVRANVTQPDQKHWQDLVPESPHALTSVVFGRGTLAASYVKNASTTIEMFDMSGRALGPLALPGLGTATVAATEDRSEAFVTFSSFNYPPTVFRVDLNAPATTPKYWIGPDVPIGPAGIEVEQVWYPSKDGTKISMFLVRKAGSSSTDAPTLLSAYGAFRVSMVPMFAAPFLHWFEAGGVLAVPNVRGGGEYGEAWHQAGMRDKKQNGIDDFIAAAQWLIGDKRTSPARLAILGLSNGGLIGGAALTMRPELFRAAVLGGPLLDMLRYQRAAKEPYWVAEYGSPETPDQFAWLRAYSPYQRVRDGVTYPAVLLTAVEGAAEVHAFHARKMAAALQAAHAGSGTPPILLRIDRPPQSPTELYAIELRDIVDQQLFLMWQLGMPLRP